MTDEDILCSFTLSFNNLALETLEKQFHALILLYYYFTAYPCPAAIPQTLSAIISFRYITWCGVQRQMQRKEVDLNAQTRKQEQIAK